MGCDLCVAWPEEVRWKGLEVWSVMGGRRGSLYRRTVVVFGVWPRGFGRRVIYMCSAGKMVAKSRGNGCGWSVPCTSITCPTPNGIRYGVWGSDFQGAVVLTHLF